MSDIFGRENFFIELQDHGIEEQKRVQPAAHPAGPGDWRCGLVATNDAHYINREDSPDAERAGLHPDRHAR